MLFFLALILIGTVSIFFIFENKKGDNELAVVKLKNESNKNLAIMLNDGSGNYTPSSNNEFPTEGYLYNEEKSGCIDNSGAKIDDALTYENGQIKVRVDKTSSCYVYFDKVTSMTALELLSKKPANLNQNIEGGLYRYQGTAEAVINNYICFGTSDKDTCTSDTDKYMYRIIGINPKGQFKLIKKEALNATYYWHNVNNQNIAWNNSDLYKGLNGISGGQYSNLFIGNTTYVPSGWEGKIEDTIWKYGDNSNSDQTVNELYNIEKDWSTTTNAKIGLMYVHDYMYSVKNEGDNCGGATYPVCKSSWFHLSANDAEEPAANQEWTMSRYGGINKDFIAWSIRSEGYIYNNYLNTVNTVRPVFFLIDSVIIIGDGTLTSPYVITN